MFNGESFELVWTPKPKPFLSTPLEGFVRKLDAKLPDLLGLLANEPEASWEHRLLQRVPLEKLLQVLRLSKVIRDAPVIVIQPLPVASATPPFRKLYEILPRAS